MSEKKKKDVKLADVVEHKSAPNLNLVLSKKKKEAILLPSVLNEGFVGIDTVLQMGMSVMEHPNGTLECFDSALNRAVSRDGGRTWSGHKRMEDIIKRTPVGRLPGFGWIRLPSGSIGMGWQEHGTTPDGHPYVKLWWRISENEGKTWSEDIPINPTGELGTPYHGEPMRITSTERLLLPVRHCFRNDYQRDKSCPSGYGWWKGKKVGIEGHNHYPEIDITYVYYSDNEGNTWKRCYGDIFGWLRRGWDNIVACDEPGLDELKDGRIMMLMRSTIGRLLQVFSEDGGEHWSLAEPSPLTSSYSPCALKKIPQTGDLLCVWNQVSPDEIRLGKGRGRLSCAITSDGVTWKHFRTLERHGRMNESDRIKTEDSILMCRSLDDVGDLPPNWGVADYPTIAFHKDEVIINYPQCKGIHQDLVSSMKIRVLPLDWFYAAP